MKKLIFAFVTLFLTISLTAQVKNISERQKFKQFDWEVTASLALGLSSTSYESSSQNYYGNGSGDEEFYSEISLALGFFIIDGLSFEPELDFNFISDAALSIIANISYTFDIPGKNLYPFFKVGYGKSSYMVHEYGYYEDSEGLFGSLDADVINASAGVKIVQSSSMAWRLELNYKNISSTISPNYFYMEPYDISYNTSVISIKIGTSLLF